MNAADLGTPNPSGGEDVRKGTPIECYSRRIYSHQVTEGYMERKRLIGNITFVPLTVTYALSNGLY